MSREGLVKKVIQDRNNVTTTRWVRPTSAPVPVGVTATPPPPPARRFIRETPAPTTPGRTVHEAATPTERARAALAVADYVAELVGEGVEVEPITGRSVEHLDAVAGQRAKRAVTVVEDLRRVGIDPSTNSSTVPNRCRASHDEESNDVCGGFPVAGRRWCALHSFDDDGGDDARAVRELATPGVLPG